MEIKQNKAAAGAAVLTVVVSSSSMFLISTLQPLHPLILQKMNGKLNTKVYTI